MKRLAMVLALVLVAGSAMANGELVGGGRTDETGNMGSGCCPSATQSSGGYMGSGGGIQSQDDGGHIGSGVGAQTVRGGKPGIFAQFYAFVLSLFA